MKSRPMSLKNRFYLSLGLVLGLVLAIGAGLAQVYDRELAQASSRRVLSTLDQIADGVDIELRRIRLLAAAVSQDESVSLVAGLGRQTDPLAILRTNWEVKKRLDRLFGIVKHEVQLLAFFGTDGSVESYNAHLTPQVAAAVRRSPSYRLALQRTGSTVVDSLEPVTTIDGTRQFQLAVAIPPEPGLGPGVEMIYLAMVPDFFNRIIGRLQARGEEDGNSFYAIVAKDGRVLLPTVGFLQSADVRALDQAIRRDRWPTEAVSVRGDRGTYVVTSRDLDRVPWRIVYFSDQAQLLAGASRANALAVGLLFLVLASFGLFFLSLHRAVLGPLGLLAVRMSSYGTGQVPDPAPPAVSPEFARVFGQFDQMVTEIDRLTRQKIEAERSALQFQINPHFLANTLSALRFMAMMSKAEGMKGMVEALMDMMSYQLSSPANRSTVAAELENIRRYEYIMKVRYGDTFDLVTEIPGPLEAHPLLTMLLQPAVENAIEHGLADLPRRGEIRITAAAGTGEGGRETLELTVRDNGRGIDPGRLAGLLDPPAPPPGSGPDSAAARGRIGIPNVHHRIRSHYGPGFGLVLSSRPGEGTAVLFRLPLEWPPGGNSHG